MCRFFSCICRLLNCFFLNEYIDHRLAGSWVGSSPTQQNVQLHVPHVSCKLHAASAANFCGAILYNQPNPNYSETWGLLPHPRTKCSRMYIMYLVYLEKISHFPIRGAYSVPYTCAIYAGHLRPYRRLEISQLVSLCARSSEFK
jgi:hypothetical protein